MLPSFINFITLATFASLAIAGPTPERRAITPASAGVDSSALAPPVVNVSPAGTEGLKLTETYMVGKVIVQVYEPESAEAAAKRSLTKRATINITGDNCDSYCFSGGSGGPNEGDCAVISQTFGSSTSLQTVTPGGAYFLFYNSCRYIFHNYDSANTLQYQNNYAVAVGNYLAGACNGAHNAHGGACNFRHYSASIECSHT